MNPQQEGGEQDELEEDQNQERGHPQELQQHQQHDDGRQRAQNFHEFTPDEQHAWLRARFDWCFAFADHFQLMGNTTVVEIAIRMLCNYMYSNHLRELPMEHVMRCSAAACMRLAILVNGLSYISVQDLIRIGENRFTRDEIFESEFHIYHSLDPGILTPARTIESSARSYLVLLETDGYGSIANLWEPLRRLTRLAIRDLLFLQYPVQSVGLAAVVLVLQLYQRDDIREETPAATLYRALGIEEDSREVATVIEIGVRLSILHQHDLHDED